MMLSPTTQRMVIYCGGLVELRERLSAFYAAEDRRVAVERAELIASTEAMLAG